MKVRSAHAEWQGNLLEGKGTMRLASGAFEGPYTHRSRFEDESASNPEELIAAAHAGCFSMALSGELVKAGFTASLIKTTAHVRVEKIEGRNTISRIELETEVEAPGIDEATFQERAEIAKNNCPVSRALASVEITLNARLLS